MTREDALEILGVWAKLGGPLPPGTTPDQTTAEAWAIALPDTTREQAFTAIRALIRTPDPPWLTPGAILAQARLDQRKQADQAPRCPLHPWQPATDCGACWSDMRRDGRWPDGSPMEGRWQIPRTGRRNTIEPPTHNPSPCPPGIAETIARLAGPRPGRPAPGGLKWPNPEETAEMPQWQRDEIEQRMRAVAAAEREPRRPVKHHAKTREPGKRKPDRETQNRLGHLENRIAEMEHHLASQQPQPA